MRIVIRGKPDDMENLIEQDLMGLPITTVIIQWEVQTPEQESFARLTERRVREAAERRGCRAIATAIQTQVARISSKLV